MGFSQGEIIWINFKFTDGTGEKTRPALVISNTALEFMDEVILLKITSVNRKDGFDFPLLPSMLQGGQLPFADSVIRIGSVQSTSTLIIDQKRPKLKIKKEYLQQIVDRFLEQIEVE
jgi:mRNA-degrading endonuclease toxin of MazEF toxin-antitoxin module